MCCARGRIGVQFWTTVSRRLSRDRKKRVCMGAGPNDGYNDSHGEKRRIISRATARKVVIHRQSKQLMTGMILRYRVLLEVPDV